MSHFWPEWGPDIVVAAGAAATAFGGGALTDVGPWYKKLKKPSWQPPNWLFAPAWTTIFLLTAVAAVLGWYGVKDSIEASILVTLFIANAVLNLLWSLLFFHLRRPDWALREVGFLWLSIASLIGIVGIYAGRAWLLLLPYILWVSFAAFLNYTIVRLNAPFKAA
jgi:tryptophan-rich sensory protein